MVADAFSSLNSRNGCGTKSALGSAMTSSDDDYATLERLAIHLENGWSDFLFDTSNHRNHTNSSRYPHPLLDRVPPDFFREVGALAWCWARDISLKPRSLCDVGGGTGRAIFELEAKFPGLRRLVLLEPSGRFCEWASRLLSSDGELPEVPIVNRTGVPSWVSAESRPPPLPNADSRLTVVNTTLERFEPRTGFDLVTCLNVVDRHSCPAALISGLGGLMNDNGLLILSSPFDFQEQSTPNRDYWIDDLGNLFADTESWSHVAEDEVFYEFRAFNRSWTRFCSQVVGRRWRSNR